MTAVNERPPGPHKGDGLRINPMLAQAFCALDGAGLPWALLRGEDELDRPPGDVDVLVSPKLMPRLDELLAGAGFLQLQAAGYGSHRFYFRYFSPGDYWLKLDIVSEVDFGEYQQCKTPLASYCLDRRVRTGPIWLPAPADQAWLLLLHCVLDKKEIAPHRKEAARRIGGVAAIGDPIAQFLDKQVGPGTAAQLLGVIRSENFDEIPVMAARMASKWSLILGFSWFRVARNKALRMLAPRLRGRGLLVGVMAPDGAGKTTLLQGLHAAFPLPTKYVYMGLWGAGPWDHWLRRIPGGRTAKTMFRVFQRGLITRYHSIRGRLVFMDRVAYDALLPGLSEPGILDKMATAVALRIWPEPHVLLVLDAPGELMFARKGEHSPDILETRRKSYLQLADCLPGATVLDAVQPLDVIRKQAAEIIWACLAGPSGYDHASSAADVPRSPLQLWALLDWRFLLPHQPQSVGYGGRTSPDLLTALRLLDPETAQVRSEAQNGVQGAFDVVLLTEPDLTLFRKAASSVQPGGWICAQVQRSFFCGSGPRTLAGWKRAFTHNGFHDVSVYWHAPTLDRSARIVPVASATAVRNTLSRHENVRFGWAKSVVGRFALALHLFEIAIPEGTVTGRRPSHPKKRADGGNDLR